MNRQGGNRAEGGGREDEMQTEGTNGPTVTRKKGTGAGMADL